MRQGFPTAWPSWNLCKDQAGLELMNIHLPLPLECWGEKCMSSGLVRLYISAFLLYLVF